MSQRLTDVARIEALKKDKTCSGFTNHSFLSHVMFIFCTKILSVSCSIPIVSC